MSGMSAGVFRSNSRQFLTKLRTLRMSVCVHWSLIAVAIVALFLLIVSLLLVWLVRMKVSRTICSVFTKINFPLLPDE